MQSAVQQGARSDAVEEQVKCVADCLDRITEAEDALVRARSALLHCHSLGYSRDDYGGTASVNGNGKVGLSQTPATVLPECRGDEPLQASQPDLQETSALSEILECEQAEARGQLLDQILLDVRGENIRLRSLDRGGLRSLDGIGFQRKPKDTMGLKHPQVVLAHVGKDSETGKPFSVWIDRNHALWLPCCGRCHLPIWHPEADLRIVWNLIGFVFIVFEAFLIPFYIAFDYEPTGIADMVIGVVNTYFMVDVVFSFCTGYSDVGVPVMDPRSIAARYACTWLFPDVLSGIPWEWIPLENGPLATTTKCLRFFKGVRLLRIARLLRLMKMGLFTDALEIIIESNRFFVFAFGVLRVLFLLFGITHWTACAWYIVGTNPSPDEKTTWISKFISGIDDLGTKYFYSVYFALTTMTTVGYGDIVAQNYTEVRFVLLLLLIASIVFAGLMGALTDAIGNLNKEGNDKSERKVMLSRYMRWRAVPKDLFMAVREHLLFLWETNEGYGEFESLIKEQLPPTLKRDLCYHIFGRILRSAPFLAWMRGCEVCMKELSLLVESMFLSKGDHLFRVGEANVHIYVFIKGTVQISQNEKLSITPGDDTHPDDDKLVPGTSGFSIPRNREANIVDVMKMLWDSMKNHNRLRELKKEKDKKILDSLALSLTGPSGESSSSDDEEAKKCGSKAADILESHVDSHILNAAFNRLHKRDLREKRSACYIQRRWKRLKTKAGVSESGLNKKAVKKLSAAKTKFVHAPAYLGESCLWTPYDEWDTQEPRKHPYSACCETRGEFVCIPRSAVQSIIEKFSPWLQQRFEYFRLEVVQNIVKAQNGQEDGDKDEVERAPPTNSASAKARQPSKNGDVPVAMPSVLEGSSSSSADVGRPPGSINYEAYAAMNHSIGLTTNLLPPGSLGLNSSTRSTRSFRQAAAAAVARVHATVTPRNGTPRSRNPYFDATPMHWSQGSASVGSSIKTSQSVVQATPQESLLTNGNGTGLTEPLLHRSSREPV